MALICDKCKSGDFEVKTCLLKIPLDESTNPLKGATTTILDGLKFDLCSKCRDKLREEIRGKSFIDYLKQNLFGIKDKG